MTAEGQRPDDAHGEHGSASGAPDQGETPDVSPTGPLGAPAEGEASNAAPHAAEPAADDELTVDDILGAAQTPAAVDADGVDPALDDPHGHLEDLRRLTAEYANYRKRTEANAVIEKQRATAAAISGLVTVLDDLDRAEAHGDLEEGSAFATIAQKLRTTLEKMGLEGFGEKGEAFDPQIHEAIAQVPVAGTEQPTVLDVIERGYRVGDVELRPAKVAVAVGADG